MTAMAEPTTVGGAGASVVLPARLIHEDEEVVLAIKPSGFFVLLVSAPLIFFLVVLVAGACLLDRINAVHLPIQAIAVVCMAVGALRLAVSCLQWLSRVYVLTNRRVLRVKGVLRVSVFECSLQRIQNTVLALSPGERLLGMGTLLFATAGTGQMEASWAMIAKPAEVHEIVVEYIHRAQQGGGRNGL